MHVKTWGHSTVHASPPSCPWDALTLFTKESEELAGVHVRQQNMFYWILWDLNWASSTELRANISRYLRNQVVMDTSTTWRGLNKPNPSNLHLSLGVSTRLKNHWFRGQQLRCLVLFGLQNCSCLCRWNPCAHCHDYVECSYFWKGLSLVQRQKTYCISMYLFISSAEQRRRLLGIEKYAGFKTNLRRGPARSSGQVIWSDLWINAVLFRLIGLFF